MDAKKNLDLAILGGGPGGYVAAIRASKLGLRTAVIEKEYPGGVCLNSGCIPTKTLYYIVNLIEEIKKAKNYGIDVNPPKINYEKIIAKKDEIIDINRKSLQSHFNKNGIELIKGSGEITAEKKVLVKTPTGKNIEIDTRNIIIATGSSAANVKPFNLSEDGVMDNVEILSMKKIPASLLIIGGGVIGCEFANIFSSLGTKVTIVEILPGILSDEYIEVSRVISKTFRKKGIDILTDTSVEKVEKEKGNFICVTGDKNKITAEKVLISVGRKPNSSGIGIEKVGIKVDQKGYVKVNQYLETNIDNIYAIGDVIGGFQLAHVASKEGKIAVENIKGKRKAIDYRVIPWAVFTSPEIGTVGLNPEQAKKEGYDICTGTFPFYANSKAYISGETQGFVSIVTDKKTGEIIGSQIVGPGASDLIHEVAASMSAELPVDDLAVMVHSHPTLSEAIMEAAEDCFGVATHKF